MLELIPCLRDILTGLEEGSISEHHAVIMLHGLLMHRTNDPRLARFRERLLANKAMNAAAARGGLTLVENSDHEPKE